MLSRLKGWLLRKLGAKWFVQRVMVSGFRMGLIPDETFERDFAKEVSRQKSRALQKLIMDLEHYGYLEWIELPRTGDDRRFLWKLRVI